MVDIIIPATLHQPPNFHPCTINQQKAIEFVAKSAKVQKNFICCLLDSDVHDATRDDRLS